MSTLANKALHITELTLQMLKTAAGKLPCRVNLENRHMLAASNFIPGAKYSVDVRQDRIIFKIDENGDNTVSPKKFRLRSGEAIGSRIDVRRAEIAEHFADAGKLMVFYMENSIIITHSPTAINNKKRIDSLKVAFKKGKLKTFALYSGVGTLDAALHDGFKLGGIESVLLAANDCWDKGINALLADNHAANKKTKGLTFGIEQLCAMGGAGIGEAHMINAGIVCKGASKLNVGTRDLPEMHDTAGHQVLNLVMALQCAKWQTPLIHVENVLAWTNTVSCSMLTRVLDEQGYDVVFIGEHDGEVYKGLDSSMYGEIEKRVRMSLLAYPKGMGDFDLSVLDSFRTGNSGQTIADIRLDESLIDQEEYEKGKGLFSERKLSKGWKTRVMENSRNVTPSLSASCWRQRVEDPRFKHPDVNDGRSRLPVPEEHAALKGQSVKIIDSLIHLTSAHTALGNGVARKPWVAVGFAIVENLKNWLGSVPQLTA